MKISKDTVKTIVGIVFVGLVVGVIWLFVKAYAPAVDPNALISGIGQLL